MKISVNQEACIGCGACANVAEDLFEINDEGFSTNLVDEVPEGQEEVAREAINACPTGAIVEES